MAPTAKDQLTVLVSRKERLFSRLQVTFDMIKNLPIKEEIFLTRAETIEETFKEFNEVLLQIVELNTSVTEPVPLDFAKVSLSFEDLYFSIKGTYNKIMKNQQSTPVVSVAGASTGVRADTCSDARMKLPTIQIPPFDGKIEKFPAFLSLYNTLVHEVNIADIEKFSYLKSLLNYPASQLLDSIEFKPENYKQAYDKLIERYSNKRLVASYHFRKMLELKPFSLENATNLRLFLDTFEDNFKSIKALGLNNLADFLILHLGLNVLSKNTRRAFESQFKDTDFPTFDQLCLFIKTQLRVSELCTDSHSIDSSNSVKVRNQKVLFSKQLCKDAINSQTKPVVDSYSVRCPCCGQGHKILACPSFLESNLEKRYNILKTFNRCFSCAGAHRLRDCKSKSLCRECKSSKHNTLLHGFQRKTIQTETDNSQAQSSGSVPNLTQISTRDTYSSEQDTVPPRSALSCNISSSGHVLLSTALAKIRSSTGEWITCRLIVDPGSQINFITNSLADRLGLRRKRCQVPVCGVGEAMLPVAQVEVQSVLTPLFSSKPNYEISAMVTSRIVSSSPSAPISENIYNHFSSLALADPGFHKPGRVDLLLGADLYAEILSNPPALIKGHPSAILTSLGWILFGKVEATTHSIIATSLFTSTLLHNELRKFWETEEVDNQIPENPEYKYCEEHFLQNIEQDTQGRFVVSLPFRPEVEQNIQSTRDIALQRFHRLEARFRKDPNYKAEYDIQMKSYVDSDHVRLSKETSDYVISHHGVSKEESSTTKLRVVFNGSEKVPGFNSLNDLLLPGKPLQTDIGELIDCFRLFAVVLTCDVKQMFRCIRLNPEDRKYVHFFWRFSSLDEILEYELTTLPFGLKCSPFLAQRVILELFKIHGHKYPRALQCLQDIYVDNIISGANSVEDGLILYTELVNLFACGGFVLHKFSSNSSDVLSKIPDERVEQPLSLDDTATIKVLGLQWNPVSDSLCYKVDISEPVFSKRGILSLVSRIFDVNGYLSPITFWIKCLLQRLWLLNTDWDDPLPEELLHTWKSFLEELPHVKNVHLPRCLIPNSYSFTQLVGFADASEKGYGCVVYLRVETTDGPISVNLIKAKSKVSPLKTVSIPRLELNAALLLSKVLNKLSNFKLKSGISSTFCFSDSKNVLCWLQTPPHQLKMYVANRVVQILEYTNPSNWHYINTKLNPADCVSRGLTPQNLITHSLYWNGPYFLKNPIADWPVTSLDPPSELPELKVRSLITEEKSNELLSYFEKFSSFIRLQRVMAFFLRFVGRLKSRLYRRTDSLQEVENSSETLIGVSALTAGEVMYGLHTYIRLVQEENFSQIYLSLKNTRTLPNSLQKLCPFVSSDGLIRVGSRLKNSQLYNSAKYPILIPKNSKLAALICDHYHIVSLHGGPQLVQSLIQRRYWIPSLRNLLRKRIFRCIQCFKSKATPESPLMADLPSYRVVSARPFKEVGVDYAGPFLLKTSKRRNSPKIKCWIASFVCMCTKALHLELVTELTTTAFFSTLDRFIARRGLPKRIFSDNGTNFVGAARKLREVYEFLRVNETDISDYLTKVDIEWRFIPPGAPHFGGIWESSIKSIKKHLLPVIKDHALTFEEFYTLLVRVEAVLNSRPLCAVSNSPIDNFDYLTPGHFLIGEALIARPDTSEVLNSVSLNKRWELISKTIRHFWKRWSTEYLQSLIPRSKWFSKNENLTVGTLVLLLERDSQPQNWVIARILEAIPGSDGIVRVVKLKTPSSVLIRPVHKIVPLPIEQDH